MESDDVGQLTAFVLNQSSPESDEEGRNSLPRQISAPQGRIIRRRARKACVACHKRKVRCDVLARGHTCTNCRLDGKACIIRSRGKRVRGDSTGPVEKVPASIPTDTMESQLGPSAETSAGLVPFTVEPFEERGTGSYATPSTYEPPIMNNSKHLSLPTDIMFAYFDFLEAETLSHIAPEDFQFLEYKGCFHFPSRPILDELVREYFRHVHPVLPVIDERAFWAIYFPSGSHTMDRRIPLFVFRAMLFVSCSFASEDTIRQLGFQSAIEARNCMYRRAKLLYDFDTTSDKIALSQGALILTYYSSDREPLANTSWLRLAIQYANSINVSMYEQDRSLSSEERLIRKRLWWCLILRDRILPLGVRRSIQITREMFDFNQARLTEEELEPEFGTSRVYDSGTKRDLARVLLAQLDLAVELTDAISYVYPIKGFGSFDQLDYNSMLLLPSKIEECKQSLDVWDTKFAELFPRGAWPNKHKSVSLYCGLTSIYYQSARAALCQCESFMLQADNSNTHGLKMKQLGNALHSSIASVSETVQELVQSNVAKYLPVSAVAYMALPIILNSLDLQNLSPTNARTEVKRRQLRLLNEAMDLCKERYAGTMTATTIIKKTIEAAKSEQNATQSPTLRSTSLVRSSPGAIQDWFEAFVSKPEQYLRVSFFIDISLSMGRYPGIEDLPKRISLHNRLIPRNSIPQSLMPAIVEFPRSDDSPLEPTISEPASNTHLDYFDFDEPQRWGRTGSSPWNGQTVDKILDEVFGAEGRFWADTDT